MTTEKETINRRDFVLRTGQLGLALSMLPPQVAELLKNSETAPAEVAALSSALRWRMIGPFRGGRVAAATGVPGRLNEFYFGAVNGGVWKSVDGGRVWTPVFDSQPIASIGAIAVAPSAPDTVYVGSGESTLRDSVGYGNGMYKSVDGGKTWTHIGLADTQHIGKIAIDPRNPDVVIRRTGGGGFGRGEDTRIAGTLTAKLTANGKSYTQTFTVKPDPRHPAP